MRGWLVTALLVLWLTAAGCGYQMESSRLPGNATTLAIGNIRNLTYTGQLDIRLKSALRRKLERNPAIRLTAPGSGELLLEIELTELRVGRALDLADTDISSLGYVLSGRMLVRRTGGDKRILIREGVTASTTLNFNQPVIETPAVREEVAADVIDLFAEQVEKRLYAHL